MLHSYILKINNTFINNAEDLGIVIPVYDLLEHSDNYSITPGSLGNYLFIYEYLYRIKITVIFTNICTIKLLFSFVLY